jgi:enterochelin esterase-like enzyme
VPVHSFEPPRGRIETISIESEALRGNLLGDPVRRHVAIYLPEGYARSDADYPLFVDLAGFTGSGWKRLAWQAFGESVPQRLDRLVAEGQLGPVVMAFPDAFTSLGGNQYVNSEAMGRWEDFLLDEMLPRLEAGYRVRRGPAHRAVLGKSSGGYGALVQGLRHGARWGAVAAHSADVDFDIVYRRDLPLALDELARHGGDVGRFLAHVEAKERVEAREMHVLMLLAMGASYDPDPGAPKGARLPVDLRTGQLDEERWRRWCEHDPLTLVERAECQASLRRLAGLFLDCGTRDAFFIHYGMRALARRLEELGIAHRYEEFDDGHSGVDYRLDRSLPFLYRCVGGGR